MKGISCCIPFTITFTNNEDPLASQMVLAGLCGWGDTAGVPERGDLRCLTLIPV